MEQNQLFNVAEVKVSYNPKFKASERPQINEAKLAYKILLQQWDKDRIELLEEFKVILLNRNNRVLGIINLSSGGLTGTIVDPKILFSVALKSCASSLILAHNHPSGNLKPSQADIDITRKLVTSGKMLEIGVIDHLIITTDGYYSFADEGLM